MNSGLGGADPGRYIRGGPRRMPFSRFWYIALGLTLLVLLAGGIYVFSAKAPADDAVEASLAEFFEQTSRGDYAAAYEHLSPVLQREIFEGFKVRTSSDHRFSSFAKLKRGTIRIAGPRSQAYTYEGHVIYDDGTERTVQASLIPVAGKWLINSIDID